jgi:hypothetical protein
VSQFAVGIVLLIAGNDVLGRLVATAGIAYGFGVASANGHLTTRKRQLGCEKPSDATGASGE